MLLALPKGLVDPGEKPEQTAIREVAEETGLTAVPVTKLGDIKYAYVRSWGDKERVFKIVSFYLFRYQSGQIDEIAPEMRIEVKRALWIASGRRGTEAGLPRRKGYGSASGGLSESPPGTLARCSPPTRHAEL